MGSIEIDESAISLEAQLIGLKRMTALTVCAVHGLNVGAALDGNVVHDGRRTLEVIAHRGYWDHQRREYPHWLIEPMQAVSADKAAFVASCGQAELMAEAFMLSTGYEAILDAAKALKRTAALFAMSWQPFARVIRNLTFHNLTIECPRGLAFPIRWRDLEFTDAMVGTHLKRAFLTQRHVFHLMDDMIATARTDFAP